MLLKLTRVYVATLLAVLLTAAWGTVDAHTMPNLTVDATFRSDGTYSLLINMDPRTFLAADPTAFPPVPATWYLDQTPEQVAATHAKAEEYLRGALRLIFDGAAVPLPACSTQAINGEDNTPVTPSTQEVHLLTTTTGRVPPGARVLKVDYAKQATTPLILISTVEGGATQRAQVAFPGESKQVQLPGGAPVRPATTVQPQSQTQAVPASAETADTKTNASVAPALDEPRPLLPVRQESAPAPQAPAPEEGNHAWLISVSAFVLICLIVGWRLLAYYRHHHRWHRKPSSL